MVSKPPCDTTAAFQQPGQPGACFNIDLPSKTRFSVWAEPGAAGVSAGASGRASARAAETQQELQPASDWERQANLGLKLYK